MPLGTEVNLGLGDVVLDGVAAPPKRCTTPSFRFMSIVANGWMDEDATWYGSIDLSPGHIVLDEDQQHNSPASFRHMSIVATVAHLSYC